jgi:hypothetical protein
LTGRAPFEGTLGKLISQIECTPPPPLAQASAGIDPALEAICLKALAKLPAERYADMASFARALDDYAEDKKARLLAEQATRAMRRRVRWLAATAVLVVAATVTAAVLWVRREDRDIAPVPEMQLTDAQRLFDALVKPLVKIDCVVSSDAPLHVGRKYIPGSVLLVPTGDGNTRLHDGPLYFSISGNGAGHVLDLSDQPGQAGQVAHFGGEITVKEPYLLFLGNIAPSSRIYIKGGIGYSILAPMNAGPGCQHVEFDGTHFLMPKIGEPKIEMTDATGAERAALHNPDLIRKTVWSYESTEYVIFCRPGAKVVPGNHELRKVEFPEVYHIIEADRKRQGNAFLVSNARLKQALRDVRQN